MELKDSVSLLLQHIIRYSFDEIFVTDKLGTVLFVSPSCEEVWGISAEDMIGQNVYILEEKGVFSPSVTAIVLQTKKKETLIQETRLGRKNLISAYPILDSDRTLQGVICFSRDITELEYLKKRNEEVAKTISLYQKEIEQLRNNHGHAFYLRSGKMEKVYDIVSKVSDLDVTVLLQGESGVGKNRLAQAIHEMSHRRAEPFVEVNCGAIPESLIESELFGYEEGAFTGAKKGGRKGYFEAAAGGTIFLDEIAELPINLQVKLLSVLQSQSITRVGGNKRIDLKCRIVCATNRNLKQLIEEKRFREDLYYRINVIKINIPPLRERKEEIMALIYEITEEFNKKYRMSKQFSPTMVTWLSQQEWPGNVRELRHFIERTIITSNDDLIEYDLDVAHKSNRVETEDISLDDYMEMMEKEFILRMYQKYPSSIKLAEKLGMSQSTANRKIRKYIGSQS